MLVLKIIIPSLALLGVLSGARADDCQKPGIREIALEVNPSKIVRANAPTELFGFNLPWRDFQLGYFRNGSVRPELVDWLIPFKGAAYRYPGGSPSNWFEWRKAVGPVSQRAAMHADFERFEVAKFGLDEFADFVNQVNGRAVITLNLSGPYKTPTPPDAIAADNVDLLNHIKNNTSFKCVGGANCNVIALELGNELDWGPYNWPASVYVNRANTLIAAAAPKMPEVKWVANGRTAPWDAKSANYLAYNAALTTGLASKVEGIAIHPYYDGIDIPTATRYVTEYGKTWATARQSAKVFVTEHGRWPSQEPGTAWESSWYKATGLGGAIASADFLLAMAGNPTVAAANWHALAVEGPWQLVRWNKTNDSLYPSPVYWGLRTMREAYLDHVVATRFSQLPGSSYTGGYDLRMIGMVTENARYASVIGINRGDQAYKIRVLWTDAPRSAGTGVLRTISSLSESDDNTASSPFKVVMKTSSRMLPTKRSTSVWCAPAHSVFSIVEP